MGLLTPGHWQSTHWPSNHWADDHWQEYGAVIAKYEALRLISGIDQTLALNSKMDLETAS